MDLYTGAYQNLKMDWALGFMSLSPPKASAIHTIKQMPLLILNDMVGFILKLFESHWFGLSFLNFAVVPIPKLPPPRFW
jgi:hypothetical protein